MIKWTGRESWAYLTTMNMQMLKAASQISQPGSTDNCKLIVDDHAFAI